AGATAGPQQRHDLVLLVHDIEETREREGNAFQPLEHITAPHERWPVAMTAEIGIVGRRRDEGVRLMMKAADCDACHGCFLVLVTPGWVPRSPRAVHRLPLASLQ